VPAQSRSRSLFRRILHPTDFSPASRRAFTTALGLARTLDAELTIAHVVATPVPWTGDMFVGVPPSVYEDLRSTARRDAQAQLDRLVKQAAGVKVRVRGAILEGLPHQAIVRRARQADLIVIGTHGRTGLPRVLLGSVAARVVALAGCPVMTVRGVRRG
jgi:universal stress protein A